MGDGHRQELDASIVTAEAIVIWLFQLYGFSTVYKTLHKTPYNYSENILY